MKTNDPLLADEVLAAAPFYERFLNRFPIPYYLTAFLIMIPNFAIHLLLGRYYGVDTLADFSWFLPLMSGVILILVVWATEHLKWFTMQVYPAFGIDPADPEPTAIIMHFLSDKTMLRFGLFFGVMNSGLGLFYGVWYAQPVLFIFLMFQIFLVGFIAGLAISGIVGILRVIRFLTTGTVAHLNLDCPDNCGGMVSIGNALLKFSLVSLMAGILIAFYIYNTPWAHRDWLAVRYFMYAWMGFPHFAAIAVLFIPFRDIHLLLAEKKTQCLLKIRSQLEEIRGKIMLVDEHKGGSSQGRFEILSTKHEILKSMYEDIESVNDWPTNPRARTSYAIIYFSSLVLPVIEIFQIITGLVE
jgi:hypothetical protein